MRVHEVARDLGITSKEVIAQLRDMGFAVKNPMSAVDEAMLARLRGEPAPEPEPKPEPPAPKPETEPAVEPSEPVAVPEPPAVEAVAEAPADVPEPPAAEEPVAPVPEEEPEPKILRLRGTIIVRDLAEKLGVRPNIVIAELMRMNILAAINQRIEASVAKQIAEKHGFEVEEERKGAPAPALKPKDQELPEEDDRSEDLLPRPPVVTFLGHVDHGKTSLLDRIRDASVASGEAGGITQHIGAYSVELHGRRITFLDTPGHAAFTAMRARGANLTDIAVIVVAADDGIMPQTREAIQHARAAGVSLLVAINKIDLPGVDTSRVLQQLQAEGLAPEDWGGDTICCPVSAETGEGMEHLLEMVLLQADILELRANPDRRADGYVVEARLEPGMGPTATLLVKRGTIKLGDVILCGSHCGRVRALIDDHGRKLNTAGPSMPVRCLGLPGVPQAGDIFRVFANEKAARTLAGREEEGQRTAMLATPVKASLENLFDHLQAEERVNLRLVLRADTQGSVEAILGALRDIKSEKIALTFILSGTGNITENDVMLGSASDAIILGFHVGREQGVDSKAKHEGVEIRLHRVIYELIDEVKAAMSGLLKPAIQENVRGQAVVREVFTLSKGGNVAGCLVSQGIIRPKFLARVRRGKEVLSEGRIVSLRHFQEEVGEVREAQECGIRLEKGMDFETGDVLEFYDLTEVKQSL